jgi:hypothetical protein
MVVKKKLKNHPKIQVKLKDKTEEMSVETFARWMCLIEAIDCIQRKCEDENINIEKVDWVKPIAIQHYINERFHSMVHDVTVEHQLGNI